MTIGEPVFIRWVDSSARHEQVDVDELPVPRELRSVGWLSHEGEDYVVVSRDRSLHPDSYEWRANLAIPRCNILAMRRLADTDDAKTGPRLDITNIGRLER